jgi:hypothetical protein
MPESASAELVTALIRSVVPESVALDFERQLAAIRAARAVEPLLAGFSAASRRLGIQLPDWGSRALTGPHSAVPLGPFSVDTLGRAALLLTIAEAMPDLLEQAVWAAYREGDTLEKIAVVRSLSLLPNEARFLELALDSGRTNDTRLFRALACSNPFPAHNYPELEFNKLYMKAAFVRAPLADVLGVSERANPELSRMALDYVAEQEAAGRAFPPEILEPVGFFATGSAVAKLLGYATHASAALRHHAVLGLSHVKQERIRSFLIDRLQVEPDAAIRAALTNTLENLGASDDRSQPR